jgi:hypothetical protein
MPHTSCVKVASKSNNYPVQPPPARAGLRQFALAVHETRNGAIIMRPVPAFYTLPTTLDDVVNQTLGCALELLDVPIPGLKRWDGTDVAAESNGRVAERLDRSPG